MIRGALEEMGASFLFLNHADLLDTHVELEYSPGVTGVLEFHGREYRVEHFRAIYVRPHDFRDLSEFADLDCESSEWRHARELQNILWSFVDIVDALVLNRPSAMLSNGSKPYQLRLIEEQGFAVPETLITTDATAVRSFRAEHGEVVYKSISGTRSIVNRLTDEHDARMDDLRWCPTQFQRYVEGVDYRVHVVGSRLFASRVLSDGVDYRYAPSSIEACELPDVVAERCLELSRALDLPLAGIDLRRAPDGQWFCFEVNPAPGYSSYEEITGQRISAAIANVLVEHDRG
ncbi:MAG: RimK domain-containing protein ATP-grasp [Actinobacteria bacterium]|nr:RimK domain-containing protein ATP-grasp [Actinomycetota bacterium]